MKIYRQMQVYTPPGEKKFRNEEKKRHSVCVQLGFSCCIMTVLLQTVFFKQCSDLQSCNIYLDLCSHSSWHPSNTVSCLDIRRAMECCLSFFQVAVLDPRYTQVLPLTLKKKTFLVYKIKNRAVVLKVKFLKHSQEIFFFLLPWWTLSSIPKLNRFNPKFTNK